MIVFSTVLSVLTFVGVSVLYGYQTFLISYNLTSIEYHKYVPKEYSPYFKPTKLQNFKNLLGLSYFSWFFPVFHNTKQNDGYFYVKSDSDIINDSNLTIK
jgi:hypothetical protein